MLLEFFLWLYVDVYLEIIYFSDSKYVGDVDIVNDEPVTDCVVFKVKVFCHLYFCDAVLGYCCKEEQESAA